MSPINVLIADDHPMFRKGMRALLESIPEYRGLWRSAAAAEKRLSWPPSSAQTWS
jgi:DNA-binding NarL/FixJ family response regulator